MIRVCRASCLLRVKYAESTGSDVRTRRWNRVVLGCSVRVISHAINVKQYVAAVSGMAAGFWQAAPGSWTLTVFALP
jgi:hypothetical protein